MISDRDGQHSDVFTYARRNRMPWSTSWEKTVGINCRSKADHA